MVIDRIIIRILLSCKIHEKKRKGNKYLSEKLFQLNKMEGNGYINMLGMRSDLTVLISASGSEGLNTFRKMFS